MRGVRKALRGLLAHFEVEDDYGGPVYGGGTLVTDRYMVDLRYTKIAYRNSTTASYNTASFSNYFSTGSASAGASCACATAAALVVSAGFSYNGSPSVDTTALHLGLNWMFE